MRNTNWNMRFMAIGLKWLVIEENGEESCTWQEVGDWRVLNWKGGEWGIEKLRDGKVITWLKIEKVERLSPDNGDLVHLNRTTSLTGSQYLGWHDLWRFYEMHKKISRGRAGKDNNYEVHETIWFTLKEVQWHVDKGIELKKHKKIPEDKRQW